MILLLLFSVAYGQSVDDIYLELSDMNFNAQKAVARASLVTSEHALKSFEHIALEDPTDGMSRLISFNRTVNQIVNTFIEYTEYCGELPLTLHACNMVTESVSNDMDVFMDKLGDLEEYDAYEDMLLHADALSTDYIEVVTTCNMVNSSIYGTVEMVSGLWQTAKKLDPISYKLSLKLSVEYDSSLYTGEIVDSRQKNALSLYQHIHNTSTIALAYSEILRECQLGVLNSDVINTDDIS